MDHPSQPLLNSLHWLPLKQRIIFNDSCLSLGAFTLLTSRFLKSRHFDSTIYTCAKNREVSVSRNFAIFWLVVLSCAITGYSACIHACRACSMHEGRGYRYTFQRARVASSPEVPKVTWWKIATFLRLPWLTSLETSRHFRKIALRLGIFLAMFRECLCVVARQLAPKCRDFSNVAKLARQCKWKSEKLPGSPLIRANKTKRELMDCHTRRKKLAQI